MVSINDVLKASKDVYVEDTFAQLWGRKLSSDYTIDVYTGTLPATLTGTKAGYLHRYKVYGNSSSGQECGERTENLIGALETGGINVVDGSPIANPNQKRTRSYEPIISGASYTIINAGGSLRVYYYANDFSFISSTLYSNGTFTVSDPDASYFKMAASTTSWTVDVMLVEGSTAPTEYIPYGYKLPLASGSTPVDIYIGDDTLSTEEYVDSGTGKIYRMVGGVLTPVNPPVPFPQIPTTANSTTISWTGEGFAPSQVEFEYERA